ncbi:hypothetical protein BTUL_0076g00530 [Botrytis tulipae]|uniref:Heterokaryon incompatibility domain-containing protein n=1 Tax=Botrytis tulipae TaxID=87230 RepID=A0A4Z1ERR7_9HELO|nr:hypothetical protein BTUL_0076g00530 [Botrytis tulipae]
MSRLPTRVIRVGAHDGLEPALFTPPTGYEGAYIALGYCWGRRKNILLTREVTKLPNMSVIFPMSVLPKTLQDAVQMTRNLGFEFLWIDSLCIIQEGDDGEDLRRECITMHEVYGSATLTIAAVAAGSVHEGIFQCPKTNPKMQSDCIIKYDLDDGSLGTTNIVFENNQQGNDRINEPLNTPGWTFQERVLSPRTIVFYKDQGGWDCASILINSNGPLNPLVGHHKDSPGRLSDYLTSHKIMRTRAASESEACMDYWRKSVEFYSRRNFTHDSNKLRAISGCAQWIKSKTGDNYLAGLWASDLRTQIFWYAEAPSSRQALYRAPSWSWASVNGRIKFWHPDQIGNIDPVTTRLGSRTCPRIPLEIDDVRMTYSPTSNEFGDVVKGSLLIRGVLKSWKMGEGKVVATKSCMSEAGIYFDEDIDEILFCLHARGMEYFLFYPSPEDTSRYFALILRKIYETFKRVGMAASSVEAFDLYKDIQGTGEVSLNCPRVVIIE